MLDIVIKILSLWFYALSEWDENHKCRGAAVHCSLEYLGIDRLATTRQRACACIMLLVSFILKSPRVTAFTVLTTVFFSRTLRIVNPKLSWCSTPVQWNETPGRKTEEATLDEPPLQLPLTGRKRYAIASLKANVTKLLLFPVVRDILFLPRLEMHFIIRLNEAESFFKVKTWEK